MELNFNSIDSRISLNEKRLDYENSRYQQIQSRIAYLTIIYSVLSIYLVQLFQFIFNERAPYRLLFIIVVGIYIVLTVVSVVYAVLLLIPKEVAYTHQPQYFFDEIRDRYREQEITDDNELDLYVKVTYNMELEEAVSSNSTLSNRKSFLYNRAFRFGLFAIIPYVIGLAFYFTNHKEQKPAFDLGNYREILRCQDSLLHLKSQ